MVVFRSCQSRPRLSCWSHLIIQHLKSITFLFLEARESTSHTTCIFRLAFRTLKRCRGASERLYASQSSGWNSPSSNSESIPTLARGLEGYFLRSYKRGRVRGREGGSLGLFGFVGSSFRSLKLFGRRGPLFLKFNFSAGALPLLTHTPPLLDLLWGRLARQFSFSALVTALL